MAFNGTRLRLVRQDMREHGRVVSQQRFAELAGYSKRTQERYETGQSEPRQSHLRRIIEVTEKTRDYFFDDDAEAARVPSLDQADVLDVLIAALQIARDRVAA